MTYEAQDQAIKRLMEILEERGVHLETISQAEDFEIQGGETERMLQEMVGDYISDIQSEEAEARSPQMRQHIEDMGLDDWDDQ